MNRYYFLSFFLLVTWSLEGLYVGNPASPDLIEEGIVFNKENAIAIKLGYERDWLLDRPMKLASYLSGQFDRFQALSDQGVLVVNFIDRFEIYGKVGAIGFSAAHRPMAGVQNRYQSYNQLIVGVGGRVLLASWSRYFLGLDLKYQCARPEIKWMTKNGEAIVPLENSKMTFSEWQIALNFGCQINFLYPYLAVKYSDCRVLFENLPPAFLSDTTRFRIKNRRKLGLALGTSLSTGDYFSFSVEVHLVDDQAVILAARVEL